MTGTWLASSTSSGSISSSSAEGHKLLARLEEVGREVVVARMGNLAGIIGAALLVGEEFA